MAPDSMRVRLHLRLIRAVEVVVDTLSELVVVVASTRSWSRCPHCGFRCRRVHDSRRRRVRDLAVSGRPVTLVWLRRRFCCDNCGERHLEVHDEFEGRLTRRMARQVVADAKVMSVRAVARRHRISWAAAMDLVAVWSALVAAQRRARRCRVLLVDETSMRRRHRYVTVLQNGETGEVLAMVAHRDQAALAGFLVEQGRRWCAGVRVVVTDGSKSYRAAIDRHLPQATHVLDRFHVVRWFAAGLTLVRREAQRREPRGHVTPAFDPELFPGPLRAVAPR
jgi:transposase